MDRSVLELSTFHIWEFAGTMPSVDTWTFELGPLLRESCQPLPWNDSADAPPAAGGGAALDSLTVFREAWERALEEDQRCRLELGPEDERVPFHEAEPN